MSSSLKSASFYLQSCLDFLKQKTVEYGGLEDYYKNLSKQDTEIQNYLEKVIMNVHRYFLIKDNLSSASSKDEGLYVGIRTTMYIFYVLILLLIFMRLYFEKFWKNEEKTIPQKVNNFLVYVITILIFTYAMIMTHYSLLEYEQDTKAFRDIQVEGEKFFEKFNNTRAIAMYYAIRNRNSEPKFSKNRKEINDFYTSYKNWDDTGKNKTPPSGLTIGNIRFNSDWLQILNSTKPDYIDNVAEILKSKSKYSPENRIVMELEQLSKYEYKLKMWEKINMLGEIRSKAQYIANLITRKDAIENPLTDDETIEIIKTEIVPQFIVKDIITRLEGQSISGVDGAPQANVIITENDKQCLLECQLSDDCQVSAFHIPSKTCSLYNKKIGYGVTLQPDQKNLIYMKGDDNPIVMIKGNELTKQHGDRMESSENKNQDCKKICLETPGCVRATTDKECHIDVSPTPIIPETITTGESFLYKMEFKQITKIQDKAEIFGYLSDEIEKRVLNICKKYNYEIQLFSHYDVLKNELQKDYDYDTLNVILEKVEEILNRVDDFSKQQKRKKQPPKDRYLSFDVFASKMDEWTFGDFLYLKDDVVVKLNEATITLNNKIEQGIAQQNAVDNIFVTKTRQLQKIYVSIIFATILILIAYLYYMLYKLDGEKVQRNLKNIYDYKSKRNDQVNSSAFFDSYGNAIADFLMQFLVPLSFVIFAIVLMFSWYEKSNAIYQYNKNILENNAANLVSTMFELKQTLTAFEKATPHKKSIQTQLKEFNMNEENKKQLYDSLKSTLTLYEKCNLITEGADVKYPFPYVDITLNVITTVVCVFIILYMYTKLDPISKFMDIKYLNKISAKINMRQPVDISFLNCDDDPELVVSLKVIGALAFFLLVIVFASKLSNSAQSYERGLYNSRYYKESKCAPSG